MTRKLPLVTRNVTVERLERDQKNSPKTDPQPPKPVLLMITYGVLVIFNSKFQIKAICATVL